MTQQLILDLPAAPAPTLSGYVVGGNAAALDALKQLQPGRALYLWGPSGSGRSHLLQALCAQSSAGQGSYLNAASPLHDYTELTQGDTPLSALVAIDDVHLLDESRQAALFTLYNLWREAAGGASAFPLLLAGDQSPLGMPLREDLRTRLGWDLVIRLEQLSDEDRATAMAGQAHQRGLRLGPEVINWILTHYSRDMGQLSALIDALDRYSLARHRAITIPLLKELLASQAPAPSHSDLA
ncbi:DnaA regulatory inactivator Hda [Pusillimonas sp. CC-YST705]|uniref:DnaA regulatory inactivator Hda n=1 Tax=Mesopusillimonas faecipullorum TaxID=2755040 RepID=A0ABS8CEQ1_9BURK|nr:DnaA regulatory inactivator Hda [Mesopusillimonas faecipullorum]MCB5364521.1 DnaA regulatory inactivator Hda [Mesopusillimonas faecipullorum]